MINNLFLHTRGGQPEFQGDILPLGELSPRDSGDYMCVAKNGHPPAIVKTIKLNVMCKFVILCMFGFKIRVLVGPEVSAVRPEVFARRGLKAKLVCSVNAYPTPHIWWFKDGTGLLCTELKLLFNFIFQLLFLVVGTPLTRRWTRGSTARW